MKRVLGSRSCLALVFERFGQPEDVVKLQEIPLAQMGAEDISIEMLASPVNPADVNVIQGVYPIKPSFPAVGGGEGVGVVTAIGSRVTSLRPGDWVIPALPRQGMWSTHVVQPACYLTKVSQKIPVELAATLTVNPTTAYRMLRDFVSLSPGDCIIQNGANSGVGWSVIQQANAMGVKTINIVRDRGGQEAAALKQALLDIGASEVVTEEFASSHSMKELMEKYRKPLLALNCVGGKSATTLMQLLGTNGVMVTYGGMSKQPFTISTGMMIFKNLKSVGYWNSKWMENNVQNDEYKKMIDELCQLGERGLLAPPPCEYHPLEGFALALTNAMKPYVGRKQIIDFKKKSAL